MAQSHFEEMIPDVKGGKRNFEIYAHSNSVLIGLGEPNSENDISIQLEVDQDQFLRLLEAMKIAAQYHCWIK